MPLKQVLFIAAILLLILPACSQESRAKRTLNKVLHREIAQFNKYHQRINKPKVFESKGNFYRVYHERTDPVVNMRRTNSIDTPYVATVSFTENVYLTRKHATREECRGDSHFILSNSFKREMIYTFAAGSWRRKEIY